MPSLPFDTFSSVFTIFTSFSILLLSSLLIDEDEDDDNNKEEEEGGDDDDDDGGGTKGGSGSGDLADGDDLALFGSGEGSWDWGSSGERASPFRYFS